VITVDPVGIDDQQLEVIERELEGHSFATAEARWAYERARRIRIVARSAAAVVLLAAFGWGMYRLGGGGKAAVQAETEHSHGGGEEYVKIDPIGSPNAKLKITAILPAGSECHSEIVDFLTKAAQARPENIRVEINNMEQYSDKELTDTVGSVCAAILVNGGAEFDVEFEGKPKHVSLVGTIPTHYTLGDLGLVITAQYKKFYGDPGEPIVEVPEGHEPKAGDAGAQNADDQSPDAPQQQGTGVTAEDLLLPSFGTKPAKR
jgi:hypothetical protein